MAILAITMAIYGHNYGHFVGIAVLKRKPTVLWLCMRYKGKLVFLSVFLRF